MAKIMFVSDFHYNLGIMHISSVLKAHGHVCDFILSTQRAEDILQSIKEFHPDIIGFSVMTVDQNSTLNLAPLLRKNGVDALIIAGGPHPTFFPDFIHNEGIDIINIGEGEYSLLDLANAVDNQLDIRGIQNLHVKKDGKIYKNPLRPLVNLDDLPNPDIDLLLKYGAMKYNGNYTFIVSRGCPYNCSFCFNHKWNKLYKECGKQNVIRLKSVEKCMQEFEEFAKKIELKSVSFSDSTFNLDKKWLLKFLEAYGKRIGIPFSVNLRADLVDEEIVKAVAETNCCHAVRSGIETGNEKLRREVLNKNISNNSIYNMAALLEKYKIPFFAYFMFGLPGETVADAFETIEMMQKIQPDFYNAIVFKPFPGMNITKYAIQKGYITEKDLVKLGERKYRYYHSILQQSDINTVMNIHKLHMVLTRFQFLSPFIKKLVRLKPNPIFYFIYAISEQVTNKRYLFPGQKIKFKIINFAIRLLIWRYKNRR
jgi:anaerobic magnesium-protoporphyrin IX monomethyl ester cyclase